MCSPKQVLMFTMSQFSSRLGWVRLVLFSSCLPAVIPGIIHDYLIYVMAQVLRIILRNSQHRFEYCVVSLVQCLMVIRVTGFYSVRGGQVLVSGTKISRPERSKACP